MSTQDSTLAACDFWGDGIVTLLLSFFGICGNIITIFVFNQKQLRSTFHANLSTLAFFDLGFTTICWTNSILKLTDAKKDLIIHDNDCPSPRGSNQLWVTLYPYIIWPFYNIFFTASIYMTVAVSLDRYIVICHPLSRYALDYNEIISHLHPNRHVLDKIRVAKYALGVSVFALFICIPTFMEYEITSSVNACKQENYTDYIFKTNVATEMRKREGYAYFKLVVIDGIIRFFIPIAILIYTNIRISLELKRLHVKSPMILTLHAVAFIFVLCQCARFSSSVIDALRLTSKKAELNSDFDMNPIVITLHTTYRILLIINSSVNCVVYLLVYKSFRHALFNYKKRRLSDDPIETITGDHHGGTINLHQLPVGQYYRMRSLNYEASILSK